VKKGVMGEPTTTPRPTLRRQLNWARQGSQQTEIASSQTEEKKKKKTGEGLKIGGDLDPCGKRSITIGAG